MGGLGTAGIGGQAGAPAAGGGAAGGGGAAKPGPWRSRRAEPEMTRVNSPGPPAGMGGGAAGLGRTGGMPDAIGGAVDGMDGGMGAAGL
jgi:hypothetical protein